MSIIWTLIKQGFSKPGTNPFPKKYAPDSVGKLGKINPPIPLPEDFRGKIKYDRKKCIGCKMCVTVCPANAMEYIQDVKKIKHYVSRCAFCKQCVDVCPVKALRMSEEFLLADTDKESDNLIEM